MRTFLRSVALSAAVGVGLATTLPAMAGGAAAAAVPSVPSDVKVVGTFTGVDVTWSPPADATTSNDVTGYVIHRVLDGVETTYPWTYPATSSGFAWQDPERIPGATYAVAAVNADGEGAASTPVAPAPTREVIGLAHTIRPANSPTKTFLGEVGEPNGSQVVPLAADGPTWSVGSEFAPSPDGREIAFSAGQAAVWRIRIDIPRAEPVKLLDGSTGIVRMAWSPDGTRIAVERLQPDSWSCIEIIPAAGGTPVQVGCNIAYPTWLPDNQTLVVKEQFQGKLERIQAKANGAVLSSFAGTDAAVRPTVSPDGRWIAYVDSNAPAVIPIAGGTPRLGETSTQLVASLTWSADGTKLLLNRYVRFGGNTLNVLPVGADGQPGAGTLVFSRPWDETMGTAAWLGPQVWIKPTATIVGPNLSVPFDTTGMASPVITCQLDGGSATPCTSPYQKAGVSAGTHIFQVRAVEPGGRTTVATRYLTVDGTAPSVQITSPAFDVTKAATATIGYKATDSSGVGTYDVRYRTATYLANFGSYVTAATATKATSITLNVAAGNEYCVSVRARDVFGTVSGWTAERCFSRPLDDRAMTAVGKWSRAANGVYYLGTVTSSNVNGVSLTRTVQAKRLFLIATKCGNCGTLQVYYGGKSVGTVNLNKATTEYQAIIPLPTPATFLSGTVQLTVRSPYLSHQIDGLAVRRT
ncbi:MAG: hypothetical protein QOF10_6619 [Kribbellaceae bacterium]|nr:hypothetical protein [Kribbellaceae bacterium]